MKYCVMTDKKKFTTWNYVKIHGCFPKPPPRPLYMSRDKRTDFDLECSPNAFTKNIKRYIYFRDGQSSSHCRCLFTGLFESYKPIEKCIVCLLPIYYYY